MKLCFIASSGGHLSEINQLKPIADENDSYLVTEKIGFAEGHLCSKVYYVSQINRRQISFIFKFMALFVRSFILFVKERPDCVISTGALISCPTCVIAHMMGRKVIYIESFARRNTLSLTGKLMKKIADLYIVQSENLLKYNKNAVYCGCIF